MLAYIDVHSCSRLTIASIDHSCHHSYCTDLLCRCHSLLEAMPSSCSIMLCITSSHAEACRSMPCCAGQPTKALALRRFYSPQGLTLSCQGAFHPFSRTGVCERKLFRRGGLGNINFQSTQSRVGEQFLMLDCRAKAHVKGTLFRKCQWGVVGEHL